ncbi:MAG: DUF4142 domain-containing protein [Bacteroidota bacterium]
MNNNLTTNRTFRIIGLIWMILICILAITSCGDGPQKKDPKESAEDRNDAKFAKNPAESDAQYLVDAYSIGLYEIEASQHAKQKAVRKDVKDLASQMIEAHSKMNESIKSHAVTKQVSLQKGLTEDQLKEIKDCSDKKGIEYDKAYLDKIVSDHKDVIKMAEEAAEKAGDPEIRNFFNTSLPALRHHVDMAIALKEKLNQ